MRLQMYLEYPRTNCALAGYQRQR